MTTTVPPLLIFSVPVACGEPTPRSPLFHLDPEPETVAVPGPPLPSWLSELLTTPPLVIFSVPAPT